MSVYTLQRTYNVILRCVRVTVVATNMQQCTLGGFFSYMSPPTTHKNTEDYTKYLMANARKISRYFCEILTKFSVSRRIKSFPILNFTVNHPVLFAIMLTGACGDCAKAPKTTLTEY